MLLAVPSSVLSFDYNLLCQLYVLVIEWLQFDLP